MIKEAPLGQKDCLWSLFKAPGDISVFNVFVFIEFKFLEGVGVKSCYMLQKVKIKS